MARNPAARNGPSPAPDETHPSTANPRFQIPSSRTSRTSLRSEASDSTIRSTSLSRLLRRDRPAPTPIVVPQLTYENPSLTAVPSPPPAELPSPLLAGCPGREISGAKSDGLGWAGDFDSPQVLPYPDDLSKTTFHEHPLARLIQWEKGWEVEQMALYGLILPAKVENGAPTYVWDSDEEEKEDIMEALALTGPGCENYTKKQTPKTTAMERPRTPTAMLRKVKAYANAYGTKDAEKQVPELPSIDDLLKYFGEPPSTPIETGPGTYLRTVRSSGSLRPKTPTRSVPSATKLRKKRSTGIEKSQISEPVAPEELRRVGAEFSQAQAMARSRTRTTSEGERVSSYAASLRSPSNLISASVSSNLPLYLLQPQHPTVYFGTNEPPPKFRLARPRLAPMEYARRYLLAKAKADKQGERCRARKPGLIWAWSEDYKEFFLLPSVPKGVARNFLTNAKDDESVWKKNKRSLTSIMNPDAVAAKRRSFKPLPLNLAPLSPILPAHLRASSQSSVIYSPDHKRDSSLDGFSLDQPKEPSADLPLLQSTKSLCSDPTADIPCETTDFFVAVQTSSESEFTNSFPSQLLSSLASRNSVIISQQQISPPLVASERAPNAIPPLDAFTATLADHCTPAEQIPSELSHHSYAPTFDCPASATSSQRTITPAAVSTPNQAQHVPVTSHNQVDDTYSDITAIYQPSRPSSSLSSCTVLRPHTFITATTNRDENNVSPNSIDYENSMLPCAPVSPLSNSPESSHSEVFAPVPLPAQPTAAYDTWDEAQTQRPCNENLQTISEDGTDFPDTSSVYSQDSVVTAVCRPDTEHRNTPLDYMSLAQGASKAAQDGRTPQQLLAGGSTAQPQPQARTLQHSPILRPLSYIPNTEAAQSYAPRKESQNQQGINLAPQASIYRKDSQQSHRIPIHDGRFTRPYELRAQVNIRRSRDFEHQQKQPELYDTSSARANVCRGYELQARLNDSSAQAIGQSMSYNSRARENGPNDSVASSSGTQHEESFSAVSQRASNAPSIASSTTSDSRRSQTPSIASTASSDRSSAAKHSRRPRIETIAPDAPFGASRSIHDACRFPALDPVMESPATSHGLRDSATSPTFSSADRSHEAQKAVASQTSDSHESELPPLKVRRHRAVANLAHIPVSQAYPQPLRFSAMKSPPPTATATSSSSSSPPPNQPGLVRAPSRLIADIGSELDREMEDVLSPRSAALVSRPESPGDGDVETPTHRRRQLRPAASMRFDAPGLPAPTKPLPSIPEKKARSGARAIGAANAAFVDADFGPGPAVSHAPSAALPSPPPPPPMAPSSPSAQGFVTRADFSVKKDRSVRPAASVAAFSYRPTPPQDQIQQMQQVRRLESAAATTSTSSQKPARTRLLGKMVSMTELKHHKREVGSGGGGSSGEDAAVGMRTFLGEDDCGAAAPAPSAKEKTGESGGRRKIFGGLFRRKGKDGEK